MKAVKKALRVVVSDNGISLADIVSAFVGCKRRTKDSINCAVSQVSGRRETSPSPHCNNVSVVKQRDGESGGMQCTWCGE